MSHKRKVRNDDEADQVPCLRVVVVQPALPKYRIPVFQELARRTGIRLKVHYGIRKNIQNIKPDHFDAEASRISSLNIAGQELFIHGAQWKYAKRRYADVLVLCWTPRNVTLLPALLRAKWNRVPVVLWGHGLSKHDRWYYQFGRWLTGKLGGALLFYDQDTADDHIRRGWNPKKIFIALNAIDHRPIEQAILKWKTPKNRLDQFRYEHQINQGPLVLYVSRLQRENRLELLIRATSTLVAIFPHIKTVIIGNGDEERHRLRNLAKELCVTKHVHFQQGIYHEEELAPWFMSADVFCYPENIGLSILHAFWYELPVVTSNNRDCHNPEITSFHHTVNGLGYAHGDVESLASMLNQVLSCQEKRKEMSNSARNTARQFTICNMVDGMEAAIRFAYERSAYFQ